MANIANLLDLAGMLFMAVVIALSAGAILKGLLALWQTRYDAGRQAVRRQAYRRAEARALGLK